MSNVQVFYEATPNPQSLKFIVTQTIASESRQFSSQAEAATSPLAAKLFGFPWAAGIFIGPNFVTVTKQEWVDWQVIADPLAGLIQEHIERGEPVLGEAVVQSAEDEEQPDDPPVVREIKKILNLEIRPAVAMDGGDIVFQKYVDGRVYLHMRGACAGCPSSSFTLKEGIETRLREAIPEIQEVVSV